MAPSVFCFVFFLSGVFPHRLGWGGSNKDSPSALGTWFLNPRDGPSLPPNLGTCMAPTAITAVVAAAAAAVQDS